MVPKHGWSNLNFFSSYIQKSISVKQNLLQDDVLLNAVQQLSIDCVSAFKNGNKVILAGNGGSAADAQHIAAEFVSRFMFDRPGLPSISLSTDTSMLTAIGNDYGFEKLFSRQLEANSKSGDIFIGISTSGNSKNIIEAVRICESLGVVPYVMTGESGGVLSDLTTNVIKVPSNITSFIQESHIMIGHMLCGYVENKLFGSE